MDTKNFECIDPNEHPFLYRYCPYKKDRLEDLLKNKRIWLSKPTEFNDPWDCAYRNNKEIYKKPKHKKELVQKLMEVG